MTSRKPPSKLDRLLKSHLKILRLVRGQIDEIGELRKVILEERRYKWLYHAAVNPSSEWQWSAAIKAHIEDLRPNDWPRL